LKHQKKTLITTETTETLIVRQLPRGARAWCKPCFAEVDMVAAELAARAVGVTARQVFRLIEAGRVHFIERPDGSSWVCLNTLAKMKEWENEENV
jgi:hypothetical protein